MRCNSIPKQHSPDEYELRDEYDLAKKTVVPKGRYAPERRAGKIDTLKRRFAICTDNTAYAASLILRKIYEIIPDEAAAQDDMIRIIDESGEDYLYHISHFVLVEFPSEVERALMAA